MRRSRRITALLAGAAMLVAPTAAFADEDDPGDDEGQEVRDVLFEQLNELADETGIPVEVMLDLEFDFTFPGEDGPVPVTIEEAVLKLGGRSILDTNEHSGYAGLPWTSAGNLLHVYTNILAGAHLPMTVEQAEEEHPLPNPLRYDIVESEWLPSTPLVPVINPLLLAGAGLPVGDLPIEDLPIDDLPIGDVAPNLPPLLFTHWGGRLTSVQGGDWTLGFHSAGTTPLGSSVDTEDRSDDPDATFPFWVPLLEDGELAVADDAIDFAGWAIAEQGGECQRLVFDIPFLGQRTAGWACVAVGVLLGDGVAFFNGEGPVDLRADLPLIWDEVPEQLRPVLDGLDDAIGQIPVDDILEQVLGLIGDVDDVVPDPDDPPVDPDDVGSAGAAGSSNGLLGSLRGGVSSLLGR